MHLGLVALLMVAARPVSAQVNTETMRVADTAEGFGLQLTGSLLSRGGNKSFNLLGTKSRLDYRNGRHAAFLEGSLQFVENEGNVVFNTGFGHLRYTLKASFATWFSYELFTQVDTDQGRGLDERRLVGAGLRFRLFKEDSLQFYYGFTPMIEYEDLDDTRIDSEVELSTVTRISNFVVFEAILGRGISFTNVAYIQPRTDKPRDLRILEQATLSVGLTRHVDFRTIFGLRYDSRAPDEIEPYDYSFTNAITVRF